jgi:hypothetical protein
MGLNVTTLIDLCQDCAFRYGLREADACQPRWQWRSFPRTIAVTRGARQLPTFNPIHNPANAPIPLHNTEE